MSDKKERMFRLLRADEIDCPIATINEKGLSLLLFKDARVDQTILDETVGPDRWQRNHEVVDGKLFCNVGIRFERENGFGEWVWKQDVGVVSYTEKEKGQASDSFKRACFNWGIGRELYTSPFIWIGADKCKIAQRNDGKYMCYDKFSVGEIEYTDGKISYLCIKNNSRKGECVYTFGKSSKGKKITVAMLNTLKKMCDSHKMPESYLENKYRIASLQDMNLKQWKDWCDHGEECLREWDAHRNG